MGYTNSLAFYRVSEFFILMNRILHIVLLLVTCSMPAMAQDILDNYRINPVREPELIKLKTMKVKMKRTLEAKEDVGWKPTVCDYWDTTYYTYSDKSIRSLYIAYNPIKIDDQYTVRTCTEDLSPQSGYPPDYKFTHDDSLYAQQQAKRPVILWPTPSDSVISTYDLDGYLLSRINRIHSGRNFPKAEYYYFDNTKRCIAHSKYNFFGLDDSSRAFFDATGKLTQWLEVRQRTLPYGGVQIMSSHFGWDTTIKRFIYDDRGNCTEMQQHSITVMPKDSAGKKILTLARGTNHQSQIFDSANRVIGFITYNLPKPDTSQRWSYEDSGNVHIKYAYAPWHKTPVVEIDSDLFDASGKKIGFFRTRPEKETKMIGRVINGKERYRAVISLEFGRPSQEYIVEEDSAGNTIRQATLYYHSSRDASPSETQVFEYRYDKNGLLTDGFYSSTSNPQKKTVRHLQYLYTFRK